LRIAVFFDSISEKTYRSQVTISINLYLPMFS